MPLRPTEMREKQRFPRRFAKPAGQMGGLLVPPDLDPRVRLPIGSVNLRPVFLRHSTVRTPDQRSQSVLVNFRRQRLILRQY